MNNITFTVLMSFCDKLWNLMRLWCPIRILEESGKWRSPYCNGHTYCYAGGAASSALVQTMQVIDSITVTSNIVWRVAMAKALLKGLSFILLIPSIWPNNPTAGCLCSFINRKPYLWLKAVSFDWTNWCCIKSSFLLNYTETGQWLAPCLLWC